MKPEVVIPKYLGKLLKKRMWQCSHSNVAGTHYNFATKRPRTKLILRIPEAHFEFCPISMMELFRENFPAKSVIVI